MLYAYSQDSSDHPRCRLLLFLSFYLALCEIHFSIQAIAENIIRHADVMRHIFRPKAKLN